MEDASLPLGAVEDAGMRRPNRGRRDRIPPSSTPEEVERAERQPGAKGGAGAPSPSPTPAGNGGGVPGPAPRRGVDRRSRRRP